jgi:hypothetical protein
MLIGVVSNNNKLIKLTKNHKTATEQANQLEPGSIREVMKEMKPVYEKCETGQLSVGDFEIVFMDAYRKAV